MQTDEYFQKYLKYKNKYVMLKNLSITSSKNEVNISGGKPRTYILYTEHIDLHIEYFEEIMKKNGWHQKDMSSKYVDLVFLDAGERKRLNTWKQLWNIQCFAKNIFSDDKEIITNKCTLHYQLQKYNIKQYLPTTYELSEIPKTEMEGIWIIRPCGIGFSSGSGIVRIHDKNQLLKLQEEYIKSKGTKPKHEQYKRYKDEYVEKIASHYIENPLLFNGLKCHFRMYLLISLYPTYMFSLWSIGKILTAKKPYVNNNYGDNEIHDTHMGSTKENYFFPKDLWKLGVSKEKTTSMWNQMNEVCDVVSQIFKPHANTYPESKTCFEVFGLDFMADDQHHIYLIEVNDKVGYGGAKDDKKFHSFSKKYFQWVYDMVIKQIKN